MTLLFRSLAMLVFIFASAVSNSQTASLNPHSFFISFDAYRKQNPHPLSFTHQQAALSTVEGFGISAYSERRFMMEELSHYRIAVALPTRSVNFGLGLNYFGNQNQNQTELGLAYGRSLGNRISIGAQFNYYNLHVTGYGKAATVNVEAGMLFYINNQVTLGVHTYNPAGSKLNKGEDEVLPSIYTVGIGYVPSEKLLIAAELEKEETKDVSVNAGVDYIFHEKLSARMGFSSSTETYFLGIGTGLKLLQLHVLASVHPQLGITPALMITYNRKTKNEN